MPCFICEPEACPEGDPNECECERDFWRAVLDAYAMDAESYVVPLDQP